MRVVKRELHSSHTREMFACVFRARCGVVFTASPQGVVLPTFLSMINPHGPTRHMSMTMGAQEHVQRHERQPKHSNCSLPEGRASTRTCVKHTTTHKTLELVTKKCFRAESCKRLASFEGEHHHRLCAPSHRSMTRWS